MSDGQLKSQIEKLRDLVGIAKGIATASVPGLQLVREDLGVRLPKDKDDLRNHVGKSGGVLKGGAGSGSWDGPDQPRFAHTPAERETYRFKESDPQWKAHTKPVYAIEMADGKVYADPQASHHADVMESAGLDPNKVKDGGFIIEGKYAGQRSDAVERLLAQREPKDKPKSEKTVYPVWEPSYPALLEGVGRTAQGKPPTAPDTREGHKLSQDGQRGVKAPKKKDGRALYGQKHQEPVKNPHITPPAGMGMVTDSFRTNVAQ